MIPYVVVKPLAIGPLTLQPFGLLVAIGVMTGVALATRRARSLGLDANELQSFLSWILLAGFVSGHVLDALLYHPREVLDRPWTLLMLWDGLGSFSGFIGAVVGAIAWKYVRATPRGAAGLMPKLPRLERRAVPASIIPMADVVLAVFPVAWAFGRAGCAVVHDHPGVRTTSNALLAVAYGSGSTVSFGPLAWRYGDSPRYDLGLLELLFTLALAAGFAITWRRGGARGWYVVAASLLYAPIRFSLDFLRAGELDGGDPRYLALTPGQWASLLLFAVGLSLAAYLGTAVRSNEPATALDRHAPAPPR